MNSLRLFSFLVLAFVILFVWCYTRDGTMEEMFSSSSHKKPKDLKASKEPKEPKPPKEPKEPKGGSSKEGKGGSSKGDKAGSSKGGSSKGGKESPSSPPSPQNCAPCSQGQNCYMNTVLNLSQNQGDCMYGCDSCDSQTKTSCQGQCHTSFRT